MASRRLLAAFIGFLVCILTVTAVVTGMVFSDRTNEQSLGGSGSESEARQLLEEEFVPMLYRAYDLSDDAAGYGIYDVKVEGTTVTADIHVSEACGLAVGVFEEETERLMLSAAKDAEPGSYKTSITFDRPFPEEWIVSVFLFDRDTHSALTCVNNRISRHSEPAYAPRTEIVNEGKDEDRCS